MIIGFIKKYIATRRISIIRIFNQFNNSTFWIRKVFRTYKHSCSG